MIYCYVRPSIGASSNHVTYRCGPRIPFCWMYQYVLLPNTSFCSVTFPHPASEPARPPRRPTASAGMSTLQSIPSSVSICARCREASIDGRQLLAEATSSVSRQNSNPRRSIIRLNRPLRERDALTTSTETSTPRGTRDALIGRLLTALRDVATSEVDPELERGRRVESWLTYNFCIEQ